ncbi:MAG: formylglycine-generating enzyme family protein [Nodosilinea sp.]
MIQSQSFSPSPSPEISVVRQAYQVRCFTEPTLNLELMLIPAGRFVMGSPPEELNRRDNEAPQHEVTLGAFLMGRYPVTQGQWRAIASRQDLQVNRPIDLDPSHFKGEDHPVESVSWYEAVEFCDRLSTLAGRSYRLPSEAEWEYACRAGTTTPFHLGETITTDLANYRGEDNESLRWSGYYGVGPKGIYRKTTTSVNYFHPLANRFGLSDMYGNVFEWCLDHYHDNYEGAPRNGTAWVDAEAEENKSRILRGGSWYFDPVLCRSASRSRNAPNARVNSFGFRVVCAPPGLL